MKKILAMLITLAMVITMLPMVVGAEGEDQSDISTYSFGENSKQKCNHPDAPPPAR